MTFSAKSHAVSALLGTFICVLGGCIYEPQTCTGLPSFSPDSRIVAWAFAKGIERTMATTAGPLKEIIKGDFFVRWAPSANPDAFREVQVYPYFMKVHLTKSLRAGSLVKLSFSPDSKHLAAVTANSVTLIDLETNATRRATPKGEYISSFVWRGPDEFAYAAHTWITGLLDPYEHSDRTFWRASIKDPIASRKRLYTQKRLAWALRRHWLWLEMRRWSPDGRYFLISDPPLRGQVRILDLEKGKALTVPQWQGEHVDLLVCWKHDSSAVFCLRDYRHGPAPAPRADWHYQALLIEPGKGKTTDISAEFNRTLPERTNLSDQPVWTPDDKYVLLCHAGSVIIRPDPYEAIEVGKRAIRPLGLAPGGPIPRLHLLPDVGVALVDRYGPPDDPKTGYLYVTDYKASRFKRLPPKIARVVGPAAVFESAVVSPDGSLVAAPAGCEPTGNSNYPGTMTVHKISPSLPELLKSARPIESLP